MPRLAGSDPEHYTTPVAMDDLEEVRVALGYGPINVWGGSYGTRAATVFLRRHPASVRTVILDGVAPVDMRIPLHFAEDGQRALTLLIESCAADAACEARFPDLENSIETLLASLDQDPPPRYRVRHPRTGDWQEISIGRELVAGVLRAVLYSPTSTSVIPLMIESALNGDFGPILVFADPVAGPQLAIGMFLSVLCAEDIPFLTTDEAAQAAEESFLDTLMAEQMQEACAVWPRGEIPARLPGARRVRSARADPVRRTGSGDPAALGGPCRRHAPEFPAPHRPGYGARHHDGRLRSRTDRGVPRFRRSRRPEADCLSGISRPPFWKSATGPGAPKSDSQP